MRESCQQLFGSYCTRNIIDRGQLEMSVEVEMVGSKCE